MPVMTTMPAMLTGTERREFFASSPSAAASKPAKAVKP
jgi:hypothetical protein